MAHTFLLVVEDDRITRVALRALLTHAGFQIKDCDTVQGGIKLLDENGIRGAVVDLMLPDGKGEEILRYIRGRDRYIPVIITTGVGDDVRLRELEQLHPDAILRKPVSSVSLIKALNDNDAKNTPI